MGENRRKRSLLGLIWRGRAEAIWHSKNAIGALAGVASATVGAGLLATSFASEQAVVIAAQVVRFATYATDEGDQPLIVVKLADGSTRQLHIARYQLQTCRKGDHIRLIEKGGMLLVHARACLVD